jgi:hypothetical protein
MLDANILPLTRPGSGVEQVRQMQEATINALHDYGRMQRLIESSALNANAYSLDDMFTDLRKGIWSELASGKIIDNFRRNLQKVHVEKMVALLSPCGNTTSRWLWIFKSILSGFTCIACG